MNKPVSNCCGAPVRVDGDVTMYHVCEKCEQACDAIPETFATYNHVTDRNANSQDIRWGVVALLVLLMSVTCSFAQRGTGANPVAVTVATVSQPMFAPMLSVIAPPTPKTNLFYNIGLVWDSVVNPLTTGYRIRYGTNIASGMTNYLVVSSVLTNTATETTSCTISNLAFRPTWYFQAATLYGTNQSEWSYTVQVQPPLESVFTLSAVFPLYSSTNAVNWITNKIVTLVQTNPASMGFFRSHLRQLDYQWTNNQLSLKPFSIP